MTFDAGALIAIERGDAYFRALLEVFAVEKSPVYVPAPVVAEVWRGGAGRQARLSSFLSNGLNEGHVHVPVLDYDTAIQIGALLARARTVRIGVTDAMVAWCVLRYGGIACTSDPDDLGKLLPAERIRVV